MLVLYFIEREPSYISSACVLCKYWRGKLLIFPPPPSHLFPLPLFIYSPSPLLHHFLLSWLSCFLGGLPVQCHVICRANLSLYQLLSIAIYLLHVLTFCYVRFYNLSFGIQYHAASLSGLVKKSYPAVTNSSTSSLNSIIFGRRTGTHYAVARPRFIVWDNPVIRYHLLNHRRNWKLCLKR